MTFTRQKLLRIAWLVLLFTLFFYSGKKEIIRVKANNYQANEIVIKLKSKDAAIIVKLDKNNNIDEVIAEHRKNSEVEYVQPNYIYKTTLLVPNDISFAEQWYLKTVKAPEAWSYSAGNNDVVVAVIDTGVQIEHPDLKNNIWTNKKEIPGNGKDDDGNGYIDDIHGWSFVEKNNDPQPQFVGDYNESGINHGTVVAGIIGAEGNNTEGVAGVAWRVKIMPLRALNSEGTGNTATVGAAIKYAVQNGANFVNLSFVGSEPDRALDETIKNAFLNNVLVIAASGNEEEKGDDMDITPHYPVCDDGGKGNNYVLGVAGVDKADKLASFSNYGSNCIDVSAPATGFYSTAVYKLGIVGYNKYYLGYWNGTSVAAPVVTGAAALLKAFNPKLTAAEVRDYLIKGGVDINGANPDYVGKLGVRLNIFASLKKAEYDLYNNEVVSYQSASIVTGAGRTGGSHIKVFSQDGKQSQEFFAYDRTFTGGVSVAAGNVDYETNNEIVVAPGPGMQPQIKIFSSALKLKNKFLAYSPTFTRGVNLAIGDVNGDGIKEIISAPQVGGGPHIRIFNNSGKVLGQFFGYAQNYRGGVSVAAGDVDGDGLDEIITVAQIDGVAQVKIFDLRGNVKKQFSALFKGSSPTVVAGNFLNNKKKQILIGAGKVDDPTVRIYDFASNIVSGFSVYQKNFKGGISVAAGDVNGDGIDEIITGPGYSGGPHIRAFDKSGKLISEFFAYSSNFKGGVNVTAGYFK